MFFHVDYKHEEIPKAGMQTFYFVVTKIWSPGAVRSTQVLSVLKWQLN